jgi:putative chitinase
MTTLISAGQLHTIVGGRPDSANVKSIVNGLNEHGARIGFDLPHRLAHFIAQVAHESGRFRYDQEIWGPTPAQKRYENRADLGHSAAVPGEAFKNRGRGPIQLTGALNIAAFEAWCVSMFGRDTTPDFSENPDLINTDPWEFLSAAFYWDKGNPTGKSLNRYADDNNIEMVTRKINGGLNGFADRLELYGRTALVLLGYGFDRKEVKRFQREHPESGEPDGDVGGKTRAALHKALVNLGSTARPAAPGVAAPAISLEALAGRLTVVETKLGITP